MYNFSQYRKCNKLEETPNPHISRYHTFSGLSQLGYDDLLWKMKGTSFSIRDHFKIIAKRQINLRFYLLCKSLPRLLVFGTMPSNSFNLG